MKILLVDDDVKALNMLAECLTRLGYAISSADTAEKALAILAKEKPDVLLCDLDLSSSCPLDGDIIIAGLKETSPDTIPIMLTGHTEETARKRLYEKPDIKILHKPVDLKQLNEMLISVKIC
ncbi:MAG: response regulator [Candidatus Omnitrophica bacterium]|nr:response regulator [Candidatus Omnitrophota bacterium]